jgi:hypothetical protein
MLRHFVQGRSVIALRAQREPAIQPSGAVANSLDSVFILLHAVPGND